MKHLLKTRLLSLLLAVAMVVCLLPMATFATEVEDTAPADNSAETAPAASEDAAAEEIIESEEEVAFPEDVEFFTINGFVSETHDVFKHTSSTIAPGVTQDINFAYSKDGKQMAYYVLVADVTRDDVVVQTSYKDQYADGKLGMEKLTNQIAYADKLYTDETSDRFISEYYKVVGGVNASFYNMTTGQPSGVTYLDGVQIGESSSYAQFFAILKDGTAVIDYTKNLKNYEGNIWQACAGSQMLVWDGVDITAKIGGSYNTERHSRTCVGVTADGKVVMMSLDGRQEPFSCGGTMHELAQIMLEQGCVTAINLDGGGSTTFAARQEGEDKVTIVNRPSDGSERSISSGLIIGSLAAPSNVFERATLIAENEYVTPGSTVTVTAKGVSPAGTAADIPENVEWQLADPTQGTVENGVFVSSGIAGDAVVQMVHEGNVVGSTTIHVVIPESITFNSASMTVPYGKSIELAVTAIYDLNEVVLKEGDISFTMDAPSIGTINGFNFTAIAEPGDAAASNITAVLTFNEAVTATSEIKLGKGSEVIFDFEDGTTGGLQFSEPAGEKYNYVWPESDEWVVTAENGEVHSGTYAMKAWVNYANSLESGYQKTSLTGLKEEMVFENATRVGMWIFIPDEAVGLWARWTIQGTNKVNADGSYNWTDTGITGQDLDTGVGTTGAVTQFKESGWHYLSIDTSAYAAIRLHTGALMQFYVSDRDGSAFGYDATDYSNIVGNFTFYIDDITVDYSEAVDDREAPVFSSVVYADEFTNDAPELNGQTVSSNKLSFTATVADYNKSNATGLNAATAKAYIDGVEVPFTYSNGKIAIVDAVLADGKHTVKFSICDNLGNYGYVIREIVVAAGSDMDTVKLVPHDASLNRILHGSIYYMDLVATNVENVQSVSTVIDLDNLSAWQLDHMDVSEGFEASYTIQADENIATVTITRTGDVEATGEAVLVSIPVRVWQLKTGYVYPNGTKQGAQAFTAKQFRDMKEFWRISLIATVDSGVLTTVDGASSTFTGNRVFVDTEMWAEDADMLANEAGKAYYNSWNGGHVHTAEAVADKAATCTEDGYTGRTFCQGCNSVADWGTKQAATGHNYETVDGVRKCTNTDCGLLFNGTFEGVEYADGVALVGWVGGSYYVEGKKLTGIHKVSAPDASGEFYYDFGEDGTSSDKFTGVFLDAESGKYRYSQLGVLTSGWKLIDGEWYYFRSTTMAAQPGYYTLGGIKYHFEENGKLTSGVWITDENGSKYNYGPKFYGKGWQKIDGETYFFNKEGYRLEGLNWIVESNSTDYIWYEFTEEGVLVGRLDYTGFMTVNGNTYYVVNGRSHRGLMLLDGDYYCFHTSDCTAVYGNYYVSMTNGLMEPGVYYFDETTGKMTAPKNGIVTEDGVMYYYVDGKKTYAGLIEIDGNYYYVNGKCVVVTGRYNIYKTNGLMEAGIYTFDETGKLVQPKNGIVEEDGTLYYYVDGVKTYAGLIEIDGNYYYVNSKCIVVTGRYNIYKTNGLMEAGIYTFDETGKMVEAKNGIVEEDGTLYYYVDGVKTYAGLIEIDGSYYYVNSKCIVVTGRYKIYKTNGLLEEGIYTFDETGKMVETKDGIVEEDGTLYYYVDGVKTYAGLIEIDGNYYYVNSKCIVVTGRYKIYKTNGLLEEGIYTFDETGKMIQTKNGIIEEDGTLYYYVADVKTYAGLIEIDGGYYYVNSKCIVVTGRYSIYKTNDLMEAGIYTFDETGRMVL